jgi:hypothetical protein
MRVQTVFTWIWPGTVMDSREHNNKSLGFIKQKEFLDKLSGYQFIMKHCALYSYLENHEAQSWN